MNIEVVGLNHRTAPVEIREKISFSPLSLDKALVSLKRNSEIKEGVILSTCNRVEIYALGLGNRKINGMLTDFLSSFHQVDKNFFQNYLYQFSGLRAVDHLFRVSSSLDSQILGENQILSQLKNAYFKARQAGTVSKAFSFIFEEAIKLGKLVRSQTQIGYGAVSISTAAVELARKIFGDFSQKKILIIGAGKIGELTLRHLYEKGAQAVLVANRTRSKAKVLAEKFQGKALDFDELTAALNAADIVISSVNTNNFLVTKNVMQKLIMQRRGRPIFFIDLGMPRNIDPQANLVENVYVYNLDDLERIKDVNLEERLKETEKVEQLIAKQLINVECRVKEII